MSDYNPMELMICVAARNLEDGATVVVGTGAPCAASMLAQKLHSPNLCIMFEAGDADIRGRFADHTPRHYGQLYAGDNGNMPARHG